MDRKKEGDLYKIISLEGIDFYIRYGFYEDIERKYWAPMPVYPNFIKEPKFTEKGFAFITAEQSACKYFSPKPKISSEFWCSDCIFCSDGEEIIRVCSCPENKIK